jgi:hypothetical protein
VEQVSSSLNPATPQSGGGAEGIASHAKQGEREKVYSLLVAKIKKYLAKVTKANSPAGSTLQGSHHSNSNNSNAFTTLTKASALQNNRYPKSKQSKQKRKEGLRSSSRIIPAYSYNVIKILGKAFIKKKYTNAVYLSILDLNKINEQYGKMGNLIKKLKYPFLDYFLKVLEIIHQKIQNQILPFIIPSLLYTQRGFGAPHPIFGQGLNLISQLKPLSFEPQINELARLVDDNLISLIKIKQHKLHYGSPYLAEMLI